MHSNFDFKRIETSSVEFVARGGGSVCTCGSLGKSTGTLGSKSTGTLVKGMLCTCTVLLGFQQEDCQLWGKLQSYLGRLKISSVCKF